MKRQLSYEKIRSTALKPNTIRLVFIVLLAALVLSFFFQVYLTKGTQGMEVFYQDKRDSFMDFFNVQERMADMSPMEKGQIYPPLAYLIIYPFNSFVNYGDTNAFDAKATQNGIMSFVIFLLIWLFIGALFLYKLISAGKIQKAVIIILILLSAPMLFLIDRGNTNVVVLGLLAVFFTFYEDENRILREIAIIALAAATGIKLYPALFGLLLFKKGTYASFFRLVGYCAALVTLPFLLFEGGLHNIIVMVKNIYGYSNFIVQATDQTALMGAVGFKAFFRELGIKFGGDQSWYLMVSNIISYLMMILSIVGSFFLKKKWQKAAILTCSIILFPMMSSFYNAVFLLIPIILFLNDNEKRWIDYVYLLLFLIILNPVQYGNWMPSVSKSIIVANICIIIINGLLCLEGLIQLIRLTFDMRRTSRLNVIEEDMPKPDITGFSEEA